MVLASTLFYVTLPGLSDVSASVRVISEIYPLVGGAKVSTKDALADVPTYKI